MHEQAADDNRTSRQRRKKVKVNMSDQAVTTFLPRVWKEVSQVDLNGWAAFLCAACHRDSVHQHTIRAWQPMTVSIGMDRLVLLKTSYRRCLQQLLCILGTNA